MDMYMITLCVTLEQETAIKDLFRTRQWLFQKSGPPQPVPAERNGSCAYDVQLSIPASTSSDHDSLCMAKPQNTQLIQGNEEILNTFTHGNEPAERDVRGDGTSEDLQSVLHDYERLSNVLPVDDMCPEQDDRLPAANSEVQLFSLSFDKKLQSTMGILKPAAVGHIVNDLEENFKITSMNKHTGQSDTGFTDVLEEIRYESKGIPDVFDVLEKAVTYNDSIVRDKMGLSDMLAHQFEEQDHIHDVDTVEDAFLKSVTGDIEKGIKEKLKHQTSINETTDVENCTDKYSALNNSSMETDETVNAKDADVIVKTENESSEEENAVASKIVSKRATNNGKTKIVSKLNTDNGKTKIVSKLNTDNGKTNIVSKLNTDNGKTKIVSKLNTDNGKKIEIYCKDCDHTFKYKRSYEKHIAQNKCRHVCSICGKVFLFGSTTRYEIHMMYHNKKKNHLCGICGVSYVEKSKLTQHMNKHTGAKPFMCDICGQTFTSYSNLYSHNQTRHPKTLDPFQCDQCPKAFRHSTGLVYHRKHYHRNDTDIQQPHKCRVCEKTFQTPDLLKRHETVHRDTKDYVCNICGAAFIRIQGLTDHKKRHQILKEYAHFCMWCGKGFFSKSCLSVHVRVHTGDKPYKCSMCDYQCAIKGNLTKHTRNVHKKP